MTATKAAASGLHAADVYSIAPPIYASTQYLLARSPSCKKLMPQPAEQIPCFPQSSHSLQALSWQYIAVRL